MKHWISYITDVGICKKMNQDALLFKTAKTQYGEVVLGAIADGLGGLEYGELASNTMLHDLSEWFEKELPLFINDGYSLENVNVGLTNVINKTHKKLQDYMSRKKVRLGTTVAILYLFQNEYLIMHVGDTRVYHAKQDVVMQMTKDHTYVQAEMDAGRMTKEEALLSDKRNVLTQCIGASHEMLPDCQKGKITTPCVFMICSDGFRNTVTEAELGNVIRKAGQCDKEMFNQIPVQMLDLIKERNEKDNISSMFLKCF